MKVKPFSSVPSILPNVIKVNNRDLKPALRLFKPHYEPRGELFYLCVVKRRLKRRHDAFKCIYKALTL